MPEESLPQPYATARRVSDDLPFVLRNSARRYMAIRRVPLLTIAGLLILVPTAGAFVLPSQMVAMDAVFALIGLAGLASMVFVFNTGGGPTLSADQYGLWIRSAKSPVKAIWLPWWSIEWIYVRTDGWETALCVRPLNKGTTGGGVPSGLDQRMQERVFGAPFTASVTLTERSAEEILAELSLLSDGRCHVG